MTKHPLEDTAIRDAMRGDFRCLFMILEEAFEAYELSPELLTVVFGLIEGKIKRPKHRPKLPKHYDETVRPALRVRELEKQDWGRGKRGAVVAEVARELGISKSQVQASIAYLKRYGEIPF